MPKLLIVEGYSFSFYSLEPKYEPPHVHVKRGDGRAKLWLLPVELVESHGFKSQELRRIHELTEEHAAYFLECWYRRFGH